MITWSQLALVAIAVLGCLGAPAKAVDEAKVLAAIEAGKQALLARIESDSQIEYKDPDDGGTVRRIRGTVVHQSPTVVRVQVKDGHTRDIPRKAIVRWILPGHIDQEMPDPFYSGPSALVAFALLSAGVETTQPRLAMLLEALSKDQQRPEMGTYVHSLRATVWSTLLARPISHATRLRYAKLLREDMDWLRRAMFSDGGYGYVLNQPGAIWDHSNTQFANLGMWAGAVANVEVANRCWLAMAQHWLNSQGAGGGWAYHRNVDIPTSSMTVAGCNSLFIVLDRHYARADAPYRLYRGAIPRRTARRAMRKIRQAIEDGDNFLRLNPPNVTQSHGYELFGLERLGLASGRAQIGGVDWFREHADTAANCDWGKDAVADAFALIFLVHGQAPILIQKLEHGGEDDWNYYNRDLAGLTRYLTRTFERLYRWQWLPGNASLREMEDAPILYISGQRELKLPPATQQRIRNYIDRGGTVFLHADRASKVFTNSAVRLFEQLFADRKYAFEPLDAAHPVFSCYFDRPLSRRRETLQLSGLSDGSRIPVFLCSVDIAGAWHQQREDVFEDLFQLMANIRVYSAPPYPELPRQLRAEPPREPSAEARGVLSIRRFPYEGRWDAHPDAWERYSAGCERRIGIELTVDASPAPADAASLQHFDFVHLALQREERLDFSELAALRAYVENGGLLLIDATDGQPAGIAAVRDLADRLEIGDRAVLAPDHPIASGDVPRGRPLSGLQTTKAGASLNSGQAPPPIITFTIGGRLAVLACPFDLSAGIDGHFIWNRIGYMPASTAAIVDNILSWRFEELASREARSPPPAPAPP